MRSSVVLLLFLLACRDAPCVRHSDCDPTETCSPAGLCIALNPDASPDADPDSASDADPDSASDADPDSASDAASDAAPDAAPDAATDAAPDAASDADPPLHQPSPDTMSPS